MLRIRDPVYFRPLDPGSTMGKNLDPDPEGRMNIPDYISESMKTISGLKILKKIYADPESGSFRPWIRDGKIRILDPEKKLNLQHC
jgi:hypothetical protein